MTTTVTRVPMPRTPPDAPDPLALAEAALRAVPDIDTTHVRAASQDGAILLLGRVQWSSEARAVGDRLRRVLAPHEVRDRIGFHYDDSTRLRPWHRLRE
ncbi:BON domain-containing protein [Actinokineospora sp. UTMC 2448]|uniref:BON domain-containing protein n=1 Tax=Actinokineospora sp. UTMC 2448 TaxID=2268449 RepID=UPI0021641B46|nr:BON domain-containing protein [Actinokineospora sp. UTMC 2448]UVS79449.1 hypothetical protein Actkin_03197 [Actinokineospora sp. UTMC 2448]